MKMNPTRIMEKLDEINDAWQDLAPSESFAGKTADEFNIEVQKSELVRQEISDLENHLKQKMMERDSIDEGNWNLGQLVVLSVAGNPKYGKNSPLYGSMGYVPTSERKSGLTRRGNLHKEEK